MLIFALGLNSIVGCAASCNRRFALDPLEQAETGFKKKAQPQILVAVYGSGLDILAMECLICLGDLWMEGRFGCCQNVTTVSCEVYRCVVGVKLVVPELQTVVA